MKLYGGIDLHSNNSVIVILNDHDQVIFQERLPNDLEIITKALVPYRLELVGIVVESTYNWYWLVDGLMEVGFTVHLANVVAIKQYEGLKHTDDSSDAQWLAHLLRLGILANGYIYPKQERPVRDLLRKRAQLVRQEVTQILSINNLTARYTGKSISANRIKQLSEADIEQCYSIPEVALAFKSNLKVLRCLQSQVVQLEQVVMARVRLKDEFKCLTTVPGIGRILGLTIMLETVIFDVSRMWASLHRIVVVWRARGSAMARKRARATPRMVIST